MQAMAVALAFRRFDVDAFLEEIADDQLDEWRAYFTLEPQGWQATRIATTRISYMLAQTHSRKRLRERDYDIRIGGNLNGPAVERARFEAFAIRQEIANRA